MTREIFLEREMLARKNDTLSFLVTFLSGPPKAWTLRESRQGA